MAPDTSRWSSMLANARKRLWWAAAAGLTIAIVFLLTGLAWPKRYSSNAYLEFFPIYDGASFPPVRPHFETWRRNALTREFLESLLDRYRLFPGQPAERRIERIQQAIVFSFTVREGLLRQRYGIQVGFVCDDPRRAEQVATDIVAQTLNSNYAYNYEHFPHSECRGDCSSTSTLKVVDKPPIPFSPEPPNMANFLELGLGLGVAVSVAVLLM